MPRPQLPYPVRAKKIDLPLALIAEIDLALHSELEDKVPYGAWQRLVEQLLREWLARRVAKTSAMRTMQRMARSQLDEGALRNAELLAYRVYLNATGSALDQEMLALCAWREQPLTAAEVITTHQQFLQQAKANELSQTQSKKGDDNESA